MNKRRLIVFVIYFFIISIYSLVNSYLNDGNSTIYLDSMYYDLKDKYNELATHNNLIYEDYQVVGCSVIERNIYNFFDEIVINRGSRDKVEVNDAVISNDRLVGIVKKVYDNYSLVSLITDTDISISVSINGSYGIYNNGLITNLVNYSDIKVGDYIYTSGLTNIPSNLYIGVVSSINLDNNLVEQNINVDLFDIGDLRHVFVIVGE